MHLNLEQDQIFFVTYYARKHKAFITRKAQWDNGCKFWQSAKGVGCLTYKDLDADGYRTATGNVRIKL
mgnify:CR=1 FL=1|tara:strand:- start:307 stop:510 length:204 start_codon:yes stop_codon:yes gene_type:complete